MKDDLSILVWDTDEKPPATYKHKVLWRSYTVTATGTEVAIPQLVEDNADHLRSEYLALVYELGEAKICGKRVIDHLEIRPGFSYWWMTLLVEKCNYSKSPQIDNVIKLLAFRDWLVTEDCSNISLVSANRELAGAMQLMTVELGIGFIWKKVAQERRTDRILRHIYDQLPNTVQALVWLARQLVTRWPFKGVGIKKWENSQAKITFVSYLFNLDFSSAAQGRYQSKYWEKLPDMMGGQGVRSNWIHLYVEGGKIKSAKAARDVICRFNRFGMDVQNHVMLDSFISFHVAWVASRNWCRIVKVKQLLEGGLQEKSGYLWPLLTSDFQRSLTGVVAMSNLLHFSLFEKAMSVLPTQEKGFYLQENQGWEFGFIHAWFSAGHGNQLMGVPHSTVKYWDLRYYFDPRSYGSVNECGMPVPDFVCVNGSAARQMYLNAGFPESGLIEVEALRYLYLKDNFKLAAASNSVQYREPALLVLGDYEKNNTMQMMELLRKATRCMNTELQYVVKPHPACPIHATDYPELDMVVTSDPIPTLIDHFSLVYTSNFTSASVDAYCAGKHVVTVLDPVRLNMSPLKGHEGISFVSSPAELVAVLNEIGQGKEIEAQGKDYFYLDSDLARWTKLVIDNVNVSNSENI